MTDKLEVTAKSVSDEIIDLSKSLDKKTVRWGDVPERPDNLSTTECVGFINKEGLEGLSFVIDIQAPLNTKTAIMRIWAIESKTDNETERFNNIQLDFDMNYDRAHTLSQKARQVTRDDIRTALHDGGTRLKHIVVSNQSGFDKTSQQSAGERYELDVHKIGQGDPVTKVESTLGIVLSKLKESASTEIN